MALRTVAAVLASLALIPAAAQASTKPKFPRTVSGSISGASSSSRGGTTVKETWSISGVRFALEHVRFVENTWTGYYKVSAGTVKFSETESGSCSYAIDKTFALKPALPKRAISTPFYLERNMLGKDSYGGNIVPNVHWNVTETCPYPDGGDPATETKRIEPGNLFDSDSPASFRIGKSMKGTYRYDDGEYGKTTYRWSLKPRR